MQLPDSTNKVKDCSACSRALVRIGKPVSSHLIDGIEDDRLLYCVTSYPKVDHVPNGTSCPVGSSEYEHLSIKLNGLPFPVIITDAVKCCDKAESSPKVGEIAICKNLWLINEIIETNPTVVVALGYVAIKALLETTKPAEMVNKKFNVILKNKEGKEWKGDIYTAYHPSYLNTMGSSAWYQKHTFDYIMKLAITETTNARANSPSN